MKKLLLILLAVILLSACSNEDGNIESNDQEKKEVHATETEEKKDDSIAVDKGILNVEITLPATLFEEQDKEQVIADAKENGIHEVTENDDGSLTYKMSKSKHQELMKDLDAELRKTVTELQDSEDFPSIREVVVNDSLSEFTMKVEKAAYENSFDGFALFSLGISGMYYQLFDGANLEEFEVTIFVEDVASGEVLDIVIFPEVLEELEELDTEK